MPTTLSMTVATNPMVSGNMPTITAWDMRLSRALVPGETSSLAARKLIKVAEPIPPATAPSPIAATVVTVDTVLVVTVDTIAVSYSSLTYRPKEKNTVLKYASASYHETA